MQSENRGKAGLVSCKRIPLRLLHLLLVVAVMSHGCSLVSKGTTGGSHAQIVEGNPEIIIMTRDVKAHGEWCSDFTLAVSDVTYFFRHAREVTGTEYAALEWYPCSISGEIITSKGVYAWNINASGNGRVTHPDDEVQILRCETCLYGGE